MIATRSKGWINKYFELVQKKEIHLEYSQHGGISKLSFAHLIFANTGLIFGLPHKLIFSNHLDTKSWTNEEKLKLLLFEGHLFIYLLNSDGDFNKEDFLLKLYQFYSTSNINSSNETQDENLKIEDVSKKLEKIFSKRVAIKSRWIENKWWINSLSNAFVYLDVLLFDDYCFNHNSKAICDYANYAKYALLILRLSSESDGEMEKQERNIYDVFLASADLSDQDKDDVESMLADQKTLTDIPEWVNEHWLLKRFYLDLSILTVLSDDELTSDEMEFLNICHNQFDMTDDELEENIGIIERLIVNSRGEFGFLSNDKSYSKVYNRLLIRWSKIINRNRDKFAEELKESKELIALVKKSSTTELTDKEKKIVKSQFLDIAKTIPSLAIFMLPGGTLVLPIILKIVPDLIPSAFANNKLDKTKDDNDA